MKGSDRRKSPRVRVEAYVSLQSVGRHANDQAFGLVIDVSRTGIGLQTPQPPLPAQNVVLRLAIGEDIHSLSAKVLRVSPRKGSKSIFDVGLDWTFCTEEDMDFLDQFLLAAADLHS